MNAEAAAAVRHEAGRAAWTITADGLSLGYGRKTVLSSIHVRVRQGEICGFRGPNGSGKSTFLKACLGLLRPAGGSLRVLERAPGKRGFQDALRRIGYVPQQKPPGSLRVTVREAVSMGRYGLAGLARPLSADDRSAVESALAKAGMTGLADTPVQELSGGQYQRTNIARALAMDPALLIFDEPTTHLDAQGRNDVVDLIGRLAARRTAGMVLVSHDEDLLALCDRIFQFEAGGVSEATVLSQSVGIHG